jgi:hypothetical protein
MSRFVWYLAIVLLCSGGFATQGFAQSRCKPEITATGHGAILESAGPTKAINAWRNEAVTRYGVFYGEPQQANEGKGVIVQNCGRTLLGLMVCLAVGRPCIADTGTEIECDRHDGLQCDPTVKWVQTRLNAKGARLLVDGNSGAATVAAIRNFRKTSKLPDGTNIDDALISALRT